MWQHISFRDPEDQLRGPNGATQGAAVLLRVHSSTQCAMLLAQWLCEASK